jgi:hypothetical protein
MGRATRAEIRELLLKLAADPVKLRRFVRLLRSQEREVDKKSTKVVDGGRE